MIMNAASRKVSENPDGIFSLMEIIGELHAGDLYEANACTDLFEELFKKSEGALFLGGPDIPPAMYHEATHLPDQCYRSFQALPGSFISSSTCLGGKQDSSWEPWLKSKDHYLISGICLGMQTMNVATGGTMIQDIPTEVYGVWTAEEILEMPPDQVHRNYMDMVGDRLRADSPPTIFTRSV